MKYKTTVKIWIELLAILAFTFVYRQISAETSQNQRNLIHHWFSDHFAEGKVPPFSFVYGGKNSDTFITKWKFATENHTSEGSDAENILCSWSDRKSGLAVKCIITCFNDFPAVEWMLTFTNSSAGNSPVIEKAAVINYSFTTEKKGSFILHHSKGSHAGRDDFQPNSDTVKAGKNIYMTPSGGRSSDNAAFPFFNIEMPDNRGVVVAVGWTGKWYADLLRTNEKSLHLKAGMERMQLSLYPGEEIRTPKICLLFWNGEDRMTGHNMFRKFVLAHHSRKTNGHFAEYPLSGSFDYGDPEPCEEYSCMTEKYAVALAERYRNFDILPEQFWLDAGWYSGCGWDKMNGKWWQNVGNWSADKERFPAGLRPVADAVHETGAKFMVWFEPERVRPGTKIEKEHPDWLVRIPGKENFLFNLGNREACQWITDLISGIILKEGIDNYRQDFNFDPMPYWEALDKPGRTGISEIRHIEGLYAFWDSLLVRFPGLLIDNCASGGRRIDLETTSRSAPLWRTDYQYGEPNGYQCHTYGLNFYLPVHGTAIYKTDNYTFRSGLGATAVTNWEVTGKASESILSIQKRIRDFKNLRPYFYADYYPLTESAKNTGDDVWLAYQMDRPEQDDGIIIAFRRKESPDDALMVKLRGIEKSALYELRNDDSGEKSELKGEELCNGIRLYLPEKQSSLLIFYKAVKN